MKPKKRQCKGYKDIIGYKPNIQNPAVITRSDITGHLPQKQKIVAHKLTVCEIQAFINNPECHGSAYRKVFTKYGERYSCDSCVRYMAQENESIWSETVKVHFNNAKGII